MGGFIRRSNGVGIIHVMVATAACCSMLLVSCMPNWNYSTDYDPTPPQQEGGDDSGREEGYYGYGYSGSRSRGGGGGGRSWGWGGSWGGGGGGWGHSGGGGFGFNYSGSGDCPTSHLNSTTTPRSGPGRIVVGGDSQKWNFGFNYSDWSIKNSPFYLNDVLVFKYDPPKGGSHPHSVYLLPDWSSYQRCDLSRAMRIATPTQGQGKGFEFVLRRWQPYYFACGESNGFHCRVGMMKFFVVPTFAWTR